MEQHMLEQIEATRNKNGGRGGKDMMLELAQKFKEVLPLLGLQNTPSNMSMERRKAWCGVREGLSQVTGY